MSSPGAAGTTADPGGPSPVADPHAGSSPEPRAASGRQRSILPGVPGIDLAICGYATALLALWVPLVNLGLLTPRIALLALGLGPGAVVLVGLARTGDRPARWGLAFLGWALVAAVASAAPGRSLWGGYGVDRGWVYLVGYLSAWALGRRLGPAGRAVLPAALGVGVGANVVVSVLVAIFEPTRGDLAPVAGRIHGFTPESVYLGGLLAGGLGLAGWLIARAGRRWPVGLAAVAALAATANLSGSRAALLGGGALAVLAVVAAARSRAGHEDGEAGPAPIGPGRPSWIRPAAVAAAVVVGVLASVPLTVASSGADRLSGEGSGGGVGPRTTMWVAGLRASTERPIVGWGPGRFRPATSARTTAAFARAEGPDRLFFDAHSLPVEVLVTTGLPGLVLAGGFVVTAVRRARGPLAWFALGVGVTWLLTPLSVSTAPAALLALGAATVGGAGSVGGPGDRRGAGWWAGLGLGIVGLVVAGVVLRTDLLVEEAVSSGDPAVIEQAQELYPADAVLVDAEASLWANVAGPSGDPVANARALAAAERATAIEPDRPTWWVNLGYAHVNSGAGSREERLEQAAAAFAQALERSPWSRSALEGQRLTALALEDSATAERAGERLCRIGACP